MNEFIHSFVSLFVVIDPFALIPIFLTVTSNHSAADRNAICAKACILALIILLAFTFMGLGIFKVFGFGLPAFQIAGGILLLKLGLEQLEAKRERLAKSEEQEANQGDDVSVFPLATPLLAGPGAISTILLQSTDEASKYGLLNITLALVSVIICSYLILRFSKVFLKVLGETGLNLFTKIMGVILTAVAVQFVLNGLETLIIVWKGL